MISWVKRLVSMKAREQYRHDKIISEYRSIATTIGCGIGDMGLGDVHLNIRGKDISVHDPELYHILDEVEESYAGLGYRIIHLDDWVDYAGWGVSINYLWLVKREENERPRFTKLDPKTELPKRSVLVEMVLETGKAHTAYRDEHGDWRYDVVDNNCND